MKSTRWLHLAGLATLGSLSANASLAQEAGYAYGGISVGRSQSRIDTERITAGLLGAGFATTTLTRDQKDTAFKLFGGYQFNRYFALEGGYFNLGEFGYTSTTIPGGTLSGQIKLQGLNLDVVGTLPISERFSAIGRVGVQVARARDNFSGTGAIRVLSPNPSKTEANYKIGVGLQYEVHPSFLVRGEVERYRVNDAVGNRGDINFYSVSLVFPLGRVPAQAVREPIMSSYVAPAPIVAEAPPQPAPVVARRRVSFSADSLFGFDAATIGPQGRVALDRFTSELAGTEFALIQVEGHTDRLGTAAYNQKLSERRAEAVKEYLVSSGRIDVAKVAAVGRGESAPVTRPGDCKGSAATTSLVACLQPDRRVVVEVSGTR
ncbi:OmpA family protein [Variovorax sp. RT4R15]|uniref:OmpA family protein n=1 Tax=Variovorax sp. RT4R15 TaxID=3443737 RepID=UPI003F4820EE